jgi:HAMP domain-containing protein/HPt (histidine-containing phosphotransfer) domain-containing protein
VTIQQRLMALIVASTLVIAGLLTWQQASSRLTAIEAHLRDKARTYSELAGNQVLSAVAFSDRETAREVLQGLGADRDVTSVTLLGANDVELYAFGSPSARHAGHVVASQRRVISETPVVSLEGPKGVLVVELSTDAIEVARSRVIEIALIAGGIALAFSTILAWLIARGIARRLRAIGTVVTAVAAGDLEQPPIDIRRRDEIGVLAAAFNAMVDQLKQLLARVRDLARKEQDRLEALVAERTDALEARTRQMRLVFDHVDQGLLVVDLDGSIAPDHSGVVEGWLGEMPASHQIVDVVQRCSPARAAWFALAWSSLRDDLLPLELAVAQLPSRFEVGGRDLVWSYKPFELANGSTRILVVISDVTAERERARQEQRERETVSILGRALRDHTGFVESCAEIARLVTTIESGERASDEFARDVHTLKGVSALLDLVSIAQACHDLENARAEHDEAKCEDHIAAIVSRWRELAALAEPFLARSRDRIDVVEHDIVELETSIARGASSRELVQLVASWRAERAIERLSRIAELARSMATRVGKGPIEVAIECAQDLRFPPRLAPLWSALAHAVRNAIDHGIEPVEQRARSGKPRLPTLTLRAGVRGDDVVVEVADDGRGIDWDLVAAAARARGLACATRAELEAALFSDGVSTTVLVSELSGRGVGLSALRATVHSLGARASISSAHGLGTTLRIAWPREANTAFITAKAS